MPKGSRFDPACTGIAVLIYVLSVWIKDVKVKYKRGQA